MIIIQNMKMPKSCSECEIRKGCDLYMYREDNVTFEYTKKNRHPQCPLKETPLLDSEVEEAIQELEAIQKLKATFKNNPTILDDFIISGNNATNTIRQALQPKSISDEEVKSGVAEYYDLYKENLDVVGWHLNGDTEALNNFLDNIGMEMIEQHIINMQEENKLLKRDVENNELIRKEAIRLGKNRLQSKLDKVREELKNRHKITDDILLDCIEQILGDEVK